MGSEDDRNDGVGFTTGGGPSGTKFFGECLYKKTMVMPGVDEIESKGCTGFAFDCLAVQADARA